MNDKKKSRLQWFLDRVGKKVYRNAIGCGCPVCNQVEVSGVTINDEMHANYLCDIEGDYNAEGSLLQYFDTKEEATNYQQKIHTNMEAIIIAFTLKGQDFNQIEKVLAEISNKKLPPILAIHGFMPRRVLIEKNYPLTVIEALEKYFPMQLNMYYDGNPLRKEMAVVARKLNAIVHVIGEVKEGVEEEINLYTQYGLTIEYHVLNA